MTRTPPTAATLLAAIPHIEYEVYAMKGSLLEFQARDTHTVRGLDRQEHERIVRTTFFEGVLLHARLLDEFLKQTTAKAQPDDLVAADYIGAWTTPGPLDKLVTSPDGLDVRDSINKQLAHLTTFRLAQQKFRLQRIHDAVLTAMHTFADHPDNKHHSDFTNLRTLTASH